MNEAYSHSDTVALIALAQEGDMEARQSLVKENTPLVRMLIKRFSACHVEREDLFQIGCIGLVKAILRYDPSFQVRFSTYAVPMITGEIKRFLRDDGAVKVSRTLKETALKAANTADRLRKELQREPTLNELAAAMEIDTETLVLALDSSKMPMSLYEPICEDDSSSVLLMDTLADKPAEMGVEDRLMLKQAINGLEPDERRIVMMRYFKNQTQAEIGKKMGMSQVQVSRMEQRIMLKMRKMCL